LMCLSSIPVLWVKVQNTYLPQRWQNTGTISWHCLEMCPYPRHLSFCSCMTYQRESGTNPCPPNWTLAFTEIIFVWTTVLILIVIIYIKCYITVIIESQITFNPSTRESKMSLILLLVLTDISGGWTMS
jgi:hypothetical protein